MCVTHPGRSIGAETSDVVLIAGGIGINPLFAIMRQFGEALSEAYGGGGGGDSGCAEADDMELFMWLVVWPLESVSWSAPWRTAIRNW